MASIIGVETLQHTNGTTAMEIDSSGIVTMANTVMYDTYRLTADHTTTSTMTAWEQPDDAMAATVGDSMSVSSGIFTFPRTGIYRIAFKANITNASGDNTTAVELYGTTDNSSYDLLAYSWAGGTNTGVAEYGTVYGEAVVNITDTSNRKIKLDAGSLTSPSIVHGHTDYNATYISFQYLAPST